MEKGDRETLIRDLTDGQYNNPVRTVCFNTAEGWGATLPRTSPAKSRTVPQGRAKRYTRLGRPLRVGLKLPLGLGPALYAAVEAGLETLVTGWLQMTEHHLNLAAGAHHDRRFAKYLLDFRFHTQSLSG